MATAKKRATIKDVAAHAGVSYQTVSRVLNSSDNVADETRQRVEAAITRLNYRPSLAARSLPGKKSFVIGFIIPYESDYLIRDPNLLAQISGADIEANMRGYNLLLSTTGASKSGLEAYKRFVKHHIADGALVVETALNQAGSDLLDKYDAPYVFLGYNTGNTAACMVHTNDRDGAKQVTQYLLQNGHQRIGLINGPTTGAVLALQERFLGYLDALNEAGLTFDSTLMTYGNYSRRSGEVATRKLLTLDNPPTAIFAFNDRMAMGAIHAIQAVNLKVPNDIAVVGFDNIPAAADFNPPLTTVCLSSRNIGQVATQLLFKLITGEMVTQREIVLPAELIIRQSA